MGKKSRAALVFALVASAGPLSAHTLYLTNGQVIVGRIVAQTRTHVTILAAGQRQVFSKQEIREISYSDPVVTQPKIEPKKQPEPRETKGPSDNRWTIVTRSAVLPGWGHFQAGEPHFGFLYSGTFLAALSYAGAKAAAYRRTEDQYKEKTVYTFVIVYQNSQGNAALATLANLFASNTYYKPFRTATNEANASLIALGGIFTIQLAHAYYSGAQLEKKTAGTWQWGVAPEQRGFAAGARYVVHF